MGPITGELGGGGLEGGRRGCGLSLLFDGGVVSLNLDLVIKNEIVD